jgi:hypothetical protein
MRRDIRGQVSLEYLVVLSLILLFFVIMGVMLYQKYAEWANLRTYLAGRTAANTLAETIDQAVMSGDGYWQTFTIHSRYPGDEYNITFASKNPTVFVETEGMTLHAPILTGNINCTFSACSKTEDGFLLRLNDTVYLRASNRRNQIYLTGA